MVLSINNYFIYCFWFYNFWFFFLAIYGDLLFNLALLNGVFFNDCTKLVLDPTKEYFEYIERRVSDKVDVVSCYTLKNYPKELHKKVTLLQHFRSYLEGIKTQPTNVPFFKNCFNTFIIFDSIWFDDLFYKREHHSIKNDI